MRQLFHTHSTLVRTESGVEYEARVYGERRADDTWIGWIEFHPIFGGRTVLSTGQETSQPDREALEYWAGGLEPIYLEGAFRRARGD